MDTRYGFAVQAIQAILAPAIMVSACGLLLLGLLNRYTVIMTRIRTLSEERRRRRRRPWTLPGSRACCGSSRTWWTGSACCATR